MDLEPEKNVSLLLNLPNELLLCILEQLSIEDILEVRATCTQLFELCNERFMSKTTLHINYCRFPTDILTDFGSSIPRTVNSLRFGEQVDFERGYEEFLMQFGKEILTITFYECKNLSDKEFLYLIKFFPDLKELEIKAHFLSVDEIFGRNIKLVDDDNREDLRRVFKKLRKFSTECCYVSPQQFNDLVELMPSLEAIKVSYISTFESCLTPRTISSFVRSRERQLRFLECGDSASDGIDDKFFYELSQLTDLQLKKITFSMKSVHEDALKAFLNTQPDLEIIEMFHSWKMSEEIVQYIGENLFNLKVLALKNGVPRLKGLSFMRELKQLNQLYLIDNRDVMSTFKFHDDFHVAYGIEEKFPLLRKLHLDNMIRGICIDCWEKLGLAFPNLTHLSLYRNKIEDHCLPIIFKHFTNLKSLNLNRCNQITDNGMLDLLNASSNVRFRLSNLKKLQILKLKRCSNITDKTFTELSPMLNLRELDLSEVDVSETAIESIVNKFPKLEHLILNECPKINNNCLKHICEKLKRLKYLNVSRTRFVLNWTLVSNNCQYLQVLEAEGCAVKCKHIYELFEKVPSLLYLKCSTLGIRRFEHMRDKIFYEQK
uniref:CSON003580 protein n=1 Tax=Culicoides sonorensis TaxID=179676 RepID=A0A336L622_CULSO